MLRQLIEACKCELFAGIDLAVSRPSTLALVDRCANVVMVVDLPNDVLFDFLRLCRPVVVAVDAPITRPEGGRLRQLERVARKRGYKLLPPMMGGMAKLTELGVCLRTQLADVIQVIETHPKSAAMNAGLSPKELVARLFNAEVPRDWSDAIVTAFVALAYWLGDYDVVRAPDGELYLLPKDMDLSRFPCARGS